MEILNLEKTSNFEDKIYTIWGKIQDNHPLIHCITNYITVNDCANILLAIGASPTMAHHELEVEDVSKDSDGVVLNMGAMESFQAMITAGITARKNNIPVILDPVGAAGAKYRREKTIELIQTVKPTCIRGNYSEIKALALNTKTACGVDAANEKANCIQQTIRSTSNIEEYKMNLICDFAQKTNSIIVSSGETDYISDGKICIKNTTGSKMMSRITGAGCMSSALLGAFLSVDQDIYSAALCCYIMGKCGEIAEKITTQNQKGTMTFRNELIDAISLFDGRVTK